MRFVPPKSSEQLAIQAVHRIRRRLVADRTRLANQVRGLLAEHGVVIARDLSRLRRALADIVGSLDDGLNEMVRILIRDIQVELAELDQRITSYDRRVRELYRSSELCQRIGRIEGIGLVPKQRSSGGRSRLFGISKRGDRYLRTLLIHGARAALGKAEGKQDPRSLWLGKMRERRHPNVVAVALANKNARTVWAMLADDEIYQPERSAQAA